MSEYDPVSGRPARAWSLGVALLLVLTLPIAHRAAAGHREHCNVLPGSWIDDLDSDDRVLIQRRTSEQCTGAARWIREQALDASESAKRQICQDLILIWTYKECEYQRDYINRRAYQPCMTWSREMHRRCLVNDLEWFQESGN